MPYTSATSVVDIIEKFESALSSVEIAAGYNLKRCNSPNSLKWDAKNLTDRAFSVYTTDNVLFEGDGREYLPARGEGISITTSLRIEVSLNLKSDAGANSVKDNLLLFESTVIPAIYTTKRGGTNDLGDTTSWTPRRYYYELTPQSNLQIIILELEVFRRLSMESL